MAGRLKPGQSNREVEYSGITAVFDAHVWSTDASFKLELTNWSANPLCSFCMALCQVALEATAAFIRLR